MSATIAGLAKNVRFMVHDNDQSNYVFSSMEVAREIVSKAAEMTGEQVDGSLAWVSSVLTLTAGSSTEQFSASLQYQNLVELRCASTGTRLRRDSEANVERMREGQPDATASRGEPLFYYPYEAASRLTLRVWPVPDAAYVYDGLVRSTGAPTYTPSTALDFGELTLRAIEKAVAAILLVKMTPEDAAERKVDRSAAGAYERDAARLLKLDKARIARLRRTPFIAPVVD